MRLSPVDVEEPRDFGLTTAQIVYRVPDHLSLLQEYVWQDYDVFPQFPSLKKFLSFWETRIEGPLHSVTVAHKRLIRPAELQSLDRLRLN